MKTDYQSLKVEIKNKIAHVILNNPNKANAMTREFWEEMPLLFKDLDKNPEVRVVILSGEGKNFSAGIDLGMFSDMQSKMNGQAEPGRLREEFRMSVLEMQEAFNAIERCRKPVIAAMHGACIGGAIDMVSACDMRYCSEDAYFCVKEIDIGMVADVGTLQRLPHIIPQGIIRELAYTGRNMTAAEAEKIFLVNQCYENKEKLLEEVYALAESIAQKSPLAIRGTKEMLNYTRDHSVEDGLNYIATWNAAMIFSQDLMEAAQAKMQKRNPKFMD